MAANQLVQARIDGAIWPHQARLVLIYRMSDPNTLQLVRLGSHSALGL